MKNVSFNDLKIGKYSTESFAIALDSTGKVYSWGDNAMG
jgi:alpha-tubulin suppressor-like RCC1 family protein